MCNNSEGPTDEIPEDSTLQSHGMLQSCPVFSEAEAQATRAEKSGLSTPERVHTLFHIRRNILRDFVEGILIVELENGC